ncbi:MAG: ABC transporter permease [Planctomycetota bacterium]|jgi:ribose transport system permease protein
MTLPVSREVRFAFAALAVVLITGVLFNAEGQFFNPDNHADALWAVSGYGILACGMTVVILTAGIDLSVGSLAALSGVTFAMGTMDAEMSGWIAVPLAVVIGAACGLLSGVLIAFLRLQPFIATLAMMAFARGLAKLLTGGVKVQKLPAPAAVEALNAKVTIIGVDISVSVFLFLGCVGLTAFLLRALRFGRYVYAIGDNEEAARLSGVPVRLTKTLAYALCGAFSGLAGVLFAALERQGNPDAGVGYELTAIAMVVVGGTSLMGGRGGIVLTVLGALTIGYLRKILDINGVDTPQQLMITGGIIVLAVLVQSLRKEP